MILQRQYVGKKALKRLNNSVLVFKYTLKDSDFICEGSPFGCF